MVGGVRGYLPVRGSGYSYLPVPSINSWYGMPITSFYNSWKAGSLPNYGLVVYPYDGNNNQFDYFASSRTDVSGDAAVISSRPLLALQFVPTLQLKMPLPGNYKWLVTTEIGA